MKHDPDRRHRHSVRLQGYDYTRAAAYFVTVCTQDRVPVLGEIVGDRAIFSSMGEMVIRVWEELPQHYAGVQLDDFALMPNHLHGIIVLVGAGPCACPDKGDPDVSGQPRGVAPHTGDRNIPGQSPEIVTGSGQPRGVAPTQGFSIPDVVHRFKSLTTAKYRRGVDKEGWPPFRNRLWQRNYYEHIIRDDEDLARVRAYIADNPARWTEDPENPSAPS
jgi:putative transposase